MQRIFNVVATRKKKLLTSLKDSNSNQLILILWKFISD